MWKRKELKERAKAAVRRNYWKAVLVSLIFAGLVGSVSFYSSVASNNAIDASTPTVALVLLLAAIVIFAIACIILADVFLANPIMIGINKFELNALRDKGNVSDLGNGFDVSYKRNVKVLFFRDLYIILWLLVFIIPGIIKAYEYRMIPYLLADNPDMGREEAFNRSKAMMKGNKWRAFVLDLSFILWNILGVITFGVVNVLWVFPYMQLTYAALYDALRQNDLQNAEPTV